MKIKSLSFQRGFESFLGRDYSYCYFAYRLMVYVLVKDQVGILLCDDKIIDLKILDVKE